MTSGTLGMEVTKAEVRMGEGGVRRGEGGPGRSDTHSGASFAIRTGAARAASQTLREQRCEW